MDSSDIEAAEFVINTKPSQGRSRLVSIVSVGLAVSGVALLVSTTSGKAVTVQNESSVSAFNVVDRRVTRSGNDFERNLASSPTKSPSSGLHKPTWKPSSKPVEHASKQSAALPRKLAIGSKSGGSTTTTSTKTAAAAPSDGVTLLYYPSETTTTSTEVAKVEGTIESNPNGPSSGVKVEEEKVKSVPVETTKVAIDTAKVESATPAILPPSPLSEAETEERGRAKDATDSKTATEDKSMKSSAANVVVDTTPVDLPGTSSWEVYVPPVVEIPVPEDVGGAKMSKEEKAAQDAAVLAAKLAQEEAMAELKAQEKAIAEAEAAAQRAEEEAAKEAERVAKAAEEAAKVEALAEAQAAKAKAEAEAQAEKAAAEAEKQAEKEAEKAAAAETARLEKEALANNVHVQDTEAVVSVAGPPTDEPCPASGCGSGPGTVANPDVTPEVLPPKPLTPEEIESKEIGHPGAPEVEVKTDIAPAAPVAKQAESDPLHTVEDALNKEVQDVVKDEKVPAPQVVEVKEELPEHTKMVSPDQLATMMPPPPADGVAPPAGTIIVLPDDVVVNEEDTGVAQLRTVSGSVSTKAEKLAAKAVSSSKSDAKTTKATTTTTTKPADATKSTDKKTAKSEINEEEFVAEVEELETKVKDLKKEVKKQKKSLAKVDTKEEKAEIKTAIEAAEVEIEDALDKEDKVVTKVVYSQDLDYFKKESKRTARKAYKKAMERANTALLTKKVDTSGAKGKVDEVAEETVALMASSGKSSKSSSSSSSKSSSKKSSSKSRRHLDEIFTSSSDIASSSDLSKSNMIAPKAKQASSSKDAVKEGAIKTEEQVVDEGLTFGLESATTDAAKTVTKDSSNTSTKTSTKEHQEGEKDIDSDASVDATNTEAKAVKPSKEGTVDLDALDEPKTDKKTDKKTATVVDTKAAFDAESHTPKSALARRKLAGTPTKSPSSGLHKPTWRPSSKPVEHASKQSAALPRQLSGTSKEIKELKSDIKDEKKSLTKVDTKDEKKELKKEIKSDKKSLEEIKLAYDAEVHTPESAKGKAVIHDKDGEDGVDLDTEFLEMEENRTDRKVAKKEKAEAEESLASARPSKDSETLTATVSTKETLLPPTSTMSSTEETGHTKSSDPQAVIKKSGVAVENKPAYAAITAPVTETKQAKTSSSSKHRQLAGSPTKSPSSGLHKPTWKPSSKPNEHRELQKNDADPCHDGLSPRCTPPTSKPVEHRSLAGSPTKSPSSGLHKPTWKPSSKPAEHRRLETRDERAEQHDTHVAKDGEDKDSVTYDMTYPSSSKSSKEILTPPVKGSKLGQVTEVKDSTTESKKSSKTDTEDSSSSSSSKKTDVPAKIAKQIKTTNAAVKDLKKMLPIESKDEKLAFKADIKEVKADIKDEKKSLTKLDTKDEKKDAKKEIKSEVKSLAEIKLAYDAEGNTPASAWGAPVIHDKDAEDVALDTEFYEMEDNRTDRKVAKKAKAEAEESLASARPSKDSRKLAGSPTKSPSSGLHKPTWKPSSKPNEHRKLAGSPTKSPSSGLHKPTWKPSSKPAEHASKR